MKASRLFERWADRENELLKNLVPLVRRSRLKGDPVSIHDLRVNTRRLRLLIRLGTPWHGKSARSAFRTWSRSISKATDTVRDADVALEWMQSVGAAKDVTATMCRRRQAAWRRHRSQIDPLPASLRMTLKDSLAEPRNPGRLRRRAARLEARFARELGRPGPAFFDLDGGAQHEYRRITRRWRYLRELLVPERRLKSDPLYADLLKAQELMGERQNLLLAQTALEHLSPGTEVSRLKHQVKAAIRKLGRQIEAHFRVSRAHRVSPSQPAVPRPVPRRKPVESRSETVSLGRRVPGGPRPRGRQQDNSNKNRS